MLRTLSLFAVSLLLFQCGADPLPAEPATRQIIDGEAMGTYYRVIYLGDEVVGIQEKMDSLLDAYNLELSAWVPNSRINAFNESTRGVRLEGTRHFVPNLRLAEEVVELTGGAYDPTVAPLVNYWGFGTGERRATAEIDSQEVARILQDVGFDRIDFDGDSLLKLRPGVRLDLNASAKGYGVDLVAELLNEAGRPDHLVDIGGEMRAGGRKEDGSPWRVAIRLPEEDATKIDAAGTLPLADGRGLATSGNYLNYYRVDGETFSHTIDPRTGYVERNRLLSASVIADNCARADAYATACMVLGPERALELVRNDPELEGYFLVRGEDGGLEIVSTL